MILRLLLVLSFTTLPAAQPVDLNVRIHTGTYDDIGDATVKVELIANVPLVDPAEIAFDIFTPNLRITSWSAEEGLSCELSANLVQLHCIVAPLAAGQSRSATLRVWAGPEVRRGAILSNVTWRERGHRAERRFWRTNMYRYAKELAVTHTGDSGAGSLRQAILDANAGCNADFNQPCLIRFDLAPSATIQPLEPLPPIRAHFLTIASDRPVMVDGSLLTVPANGLTVAPPAAEIYIRGLTIQSFPENGIEITSSGEVTIDSCVIAGNRSRGVVTLAGRVTLSDDVIGNNGRSGVFGHGGSLMAVRNRIGVAADGVTPMPNGASGIFFRGGSFTAYIADNVIAHNSHFGIGTHRSSPFVDVGRNRIIGNGGGAIDIDLDGPSFFVPDMRQLWTPNGPTLHSATYDPATNKTIIRGRLDHAEFLWYLNYDLQFYASTAANEAGQYLGAIHITAPDFTFTAHGDLRGRFVTAHSIRILTDDRNVRGTSELSAPIEVRP